MTTIAVVCMVRIASPPRRRPDACLIHPQIDITDRDCRVFVGKAETGDASDLRYHDPAVARS
jgi:hypothetical protein